MKSIHVPYLGQFWTEDVPTSISCSWHSWATNRMLCRIHKTQKRKESCFLSRAFFVLSFLILAITLINSPDPIWWRSICYRQTTHKSLQSLQSLRQKGKSWVIFQDKKAQSWIIYADCYMIFANSNQLDSSQNYLQSWTLQPKNSQSCLPKMEYSKANPPD
jgi:hypothetical protein